MIAVTVDGNAIAPGQLEMHHQDDPFPGGSRYTLCIHDSELAEVVALDFPQTIQQALPEAQAGALFNLLRPYISRHVGRIKPLFWANSVDSMMVTDSTVELSGVCSPHVS
jgi:hypothetical protein